MLHDPGTSFAADHALIDGMIAIPSDIADLALCEMHVDAATACAHIASGLAHLIADVGRRLNTVTFVRGSGIGQRAFGWRDAGLAIGAHAPLQPASCLKSVGRLFGPEPRI